MLNLSNGQMLMNGGIGLMAASVITAIICTVIFSITGKKINKELEDDYGKPEY